MMDWLWALLLVIAGNVVLFVLLALAAALARILRVQKDPD